VVPFPHIHLSRFTLRAKDKNHTGSGALLASLPAGAIRARNSGVAFGIRMRTTHLDL
jgi:hypothetical protein